MLDNSNHDDYLTKLCPCCRSHVAIHPRQALKRGRLPKTAINYPNPFINYPNHFIRYLKTSFYRLNFIYFKTILNFKIMLNLRLFEKLSYHLIVLILLVTILGVQGI